MGCCDNRVVWWHGFDCIAQIERGAVMWFAYWIGVACGVLLGMFIVSVFIGVDEDGG